MKIQGAACGKAIGLWALAYELLVGNEMPLDSWLPRVKAAFPHLCEWEREAFCVRLQHECVMWSHATAKCVS